MSLLARIAAAFGPVKAAPEGEYRPGPYDTTVGMLPDAWGKYVNFWQMGYIPGSSGTSAMVEACVSAYAQTIAMCPFAHWSETGDNGREKVTTSALSRIMRQPNDYQTRSDFLLNLVRSLYLEGNAYAIALRNNRYEIASLHLMNPRQCFGQSYEGEVFYALGGNIVIQDRLEALGLVPRETLAAVPARDVLHVKLQTPVTPLRGETPLTAAALAMAVNSASMVQQGQFYANMARPSGVLQTDLTLTKAQVDEMRARWNEHSQGLGAGGTPILTSGLKFAPVTISPKDTQFAETQKYSDAQIAQVFRIPLSIIGSEAQPMGSTEALMNLWIETGLGFALDHIEQAFDRTFGLDTVANEYCELDSSVLLRSAFKDRIDGLARAVQGGIYSPNEARAVESLPKAKDGDEPRVQQQVVPLSFNANPPPPPPPAAPPVSSSAPPPPPPPKKDITVSEWNSYFEDAA